MLVIVTYDVETKTREGQTRLRRVARVCVNYGQRVQNSVFECLVDPTQYAILKMKLSDIIDPKKDSVRFYLAGKNWEKRVEKLGADTSYNPEGGLII